VSVSFSCRATTVHQRPRPASMKGNAPISRSFLEKETTTAVASALVCDSHTSYARSIPPIRGYIDSCRRMARIPLRTRKMQRTRQEDALARSQRAPITLDHSFVRSFVHPIDLSPIFAVLPRSAISAPTIGTKLPRTHKRRKTRHALSLSLSSLCRDPRESPIVIGWPGRSGPRH